MQPTTTIQEGPIRFSVEWRNWRGAPVKNQKGPEVDRRSRLKLADHNYNFADGLSIGQPLYRVGALFEGETLGDRRPDLPLRVVRQ